MNVRKTSLVGARDAADELYKTFYVLMMLHRTSKVRAVFHHSKTLHDLIHLSCDDASRGYAPRAWGGPERDKCMSAFRRMMVFGLAMKHLPQMEALGAKIVRLAGDFERNFREDVES